MEPNYDFIMSSGQSPKRSLLSGSSTKGRAIIFFGGLAFVIVLFVVVGNVLGASGKQASNNITDLAAYQSELKRIIAIGAEKSRDSNLRSKAVTAKYVLESDYQSTVKLMRGRGIKAPKDFTTRYSSKTLDTQLDDADKSNNFDAEYQAIYTEKLTNYKTKMSSIYPTLSASEQAVVKQQNNNAKILLGEPLDTPSQ